MPEITVNIDGVQRVARAALDEFAQATFADIRAATDATAKEVVKRTKAASPYRTGEYRKGWTSRVEVDNSRDYQRTVYNKRKTGLTHLLQHGHGGPHPAPAHPHITGDDEVQEIFVKALTDEMGKE